jgi:sortase A
MSKRMKSSLSSHHLQRLLRWTARFLLIAGVVALGSAGIILIRAQLYQSYQAYSLRQALLDRPASIAGFLTHWFDRHTIGSPSLQRKANPSTAKEGTDRRHSSVRENSPAQPGQRASSHPIVEGSPIGLLEIPRLGVSVILLEGTDDETLRFGVGHIKQTALPGETGNVGVAGHRDTFFRALRNTRKGDEIRIMTLKGYFEYRVQSMEIVNPRDTWVLNASSSPSLTLVTCYPFYFIGSAPKRFIVQSVQTEAYGQDISMRWRTGICRYLQLGYDQEISRFKAQPVNAAEWRTSR